MLRRKHNRFVSRMLAVAIAATSIFATSPMTQAKTVEVTTEASQVAAEETDYYSCKRNRFNTVCMERRDKIKR